MGNKRYVDPNARPVLAGQTDDPLQPLRDELMADPAPTSQARYWLSEAWSEEAAIRIAKLDPVEWSEWKNDSEEHTYLVGEAKRLGRLKVEAEIRSTSLGISTRRGQAAAQRMHMALLEGNSETRGRKPGEPKLNGFERDGDFDRIMAQLPEDPDELRALAEEEDPDA